MYMTAYDSWLVGILHSNIRCQIVFAKSAGAEILKLIYNCVVYSY